jgi:hypothetical protein
MLGKSKFGESCEKGNSCKLHEGRGRKKKKRKNRLSGRLKPKK